MGSRYRFDLAHESSEICDLGHPICGLYLLYGLYLLAIGPDGTREPSVWRSARLGQATLNRDKSDRCVWYRFHSSSIEHTFDTGKRSPQKLRLRNSDPPVRRLETRTTGSELWAQLSTYPKSAGVGTLTPGV